MSEQPALPDGVMLLTDLHKMFMSQVLLYREQRNSGQVPNEKQERLATSVLHYLGELSRVQEKDVADPAGAMAADNVIAKRCKALPEKARAAVLTHLRSLMPTVQALLGDQDPNDPLIKTRIIRLHSELMLAMTMLVEDAKDLIEKPRIITIN